MLETPFFTAPLFWHQSIRILKKPDLKVLVVRINKFWYDYIGYNFGWSKFSVGGRDIMSALLQAAERGVDVRIMVDGINGALYLTGSGNFRELASYENVPCAKPYEKPVHRRGVLEEHYLAVREAYPEAFTEVEREMETVETEGIELCTNPMKPENKSPLLWDRVVEEMAQGKEILIQTPYIICSRMMYQALADMVHRTGKLIRIICDEEQKIMKTDI